MGMKPIEREKHVALDPFRALDCIWLDLGMGAFGFVAFELRRLMSYEDMQYMHTMIKRIAGPFEIAKERCDMPNMNYKLVMLSSGI
jgi:hypothetical protein